MGTKLECAVNPLATSQNSNSCSFTVHFVDDYFRTRTLKENCQKIGLERSGSCMDRMLERHNMESIRKTMEMHEDTFKHQVVRELHRLYSVQKMLMDEQQLTAQTTCGYNFHVQGDPSSRERSGSCSGDTMKVARGFDLERPAEEDISAEVSAVDHEDQVGRSSLMHSRINQMSIEGSDEDSEVELTLSIGGSSSKKTPTNSKPHSQELGCNNSQSIHKETRELHSSASFKSERREDCSGPNTPMSSSSATFDQDRKRPHWLFQGLSINRT
ncbi:A-kinase anchor protein 9, putative isoform 3 [Theobroma cacao]|uniref:A-kinase anchor protein 9, putative isoform 3 n=1 Tax=Theobroma cacao TaxID=3641 RepID=A0A061GR80_THECC|nr:A-kinase anchor protein 9, putative isoform 3 [Theobroma cacao]